MIYRGRTRTKLIQKNVDISLSSFFLSFFETSAVHADAHGPEPKEEDVKEEDNATEEAEAEEPEDVSLFLSLWVLVLLWG